MLLRELVGKRFKETPGEATLASHSILLRGGYIRQVANGIYSLLPLGLRVVRKIEAIIREEMNAIGGQEVLMPFVLPKELWDQSGRNKSIGSELVRFKDRVEHEMVLAMTHEEAVVHLCRNESTSYRNYPFMVYQIQTKFRDELRSRGGLIRLRESTMKDAYSFHRDQKSLQEFYNICADTYTRIFTRAGIAEVKKVESDSGMMGGLIAHEFTYLTDSGEDTIVVCQKCDYAANLEIARTRYNPITAETTDALKKVYTPGKRTIAEISEFLSVPESRTAKVVFYARDSAGIPVMAIIRGDLNVNDAKLATIIGVVPVAADDRVLFDCGAVPGFASPMGVHDCRIIADQSLTTTTNLVTGANETDYHCINFDLRRDVPEFELADIAQVKQGDCCPRCLGNLTFKKGIEAGKLFQLGSKYTGKMGMRYLDESGKECTPLMCSYGIGIGRLMADVIEARHDKFGPVWPVSIAPFTVHITALNLTAEEKQSFGLPLYQNLCRSGLDVIYDDRDERPGVQFADADLIGAPLRLIIGKKNIAEGRIEWKRRDGSAKGVVEYEKAVEFVSDFLGKEKAWKWAEGTQ